MITKNGESVLPHQNWRGQFSRGTYASGVSSDCAPGQNYNCAKIAWPGWRTTAWHVDAKDPDIRTWWGGLVDGMRDVSGQMYMRNRYYDPATGQFTQTDPIGIAGGLNVYGFANGDPVGFWDPFGLTVMVRGDESFVRRTWGALNFARRHSATFGRIFDALHGTRAVRHFIHNTPGYCPGDACTMYRAGSSASHVNWRGGDVDEYSWSELATLVHETMHAAGIWRRHTGVDKECATQEPSGGSNHCVDRHVGEVMGEIRASYLRTSNRLGFYNERLAERSNRSEKPDDGN